MAGQVPAGVAAAGAGMAFGVSALVTAGWILWARRRNIVDAPGQRRLHVHATPRGGGVGIALVALAYLGFAVYGYFDFGGNDRESAAVVLGLLLAVATGLIDDLRPGTPTAVKFGGQILAGAAIAWALPWPGLDAPWGQTIAFAWVLVAINFWNFMDGANGMVALQSVVVALALAVLLDSTHAVIALALAAACLGFLPFNLPKARVFMGDTGSHVLGAMVAILSLWALRSGKASPGQVLILISAFLIDAGLTLAKRILLGRRFWRAHREHLYQWAVRRGHSHARVCLAYAAWAILSASVALGWGARGPTEAVVAALAVGLAGATTWVVLRRHWLKRETRMDAST